MAVVAILQQLALYQIYGAMSPLKGLPSLIVASRELFYFIFLVVKSMTSFL
jgi:hypothetical protein